MWSNILLLLVQDFVSDRGLSARWIGRGASAVVRYHCGQAAAPLMVVGCGFCAVPVDAHDRAGRRTGSALERRGPDRRHGDVIGAWVGGGPDHAPVQGHRLECSPEFS